MADLAREITVPCEIGFMCAKSYYTGTVSSGVVQITMDLEQDISNYYHSVTGVMSLNANNMLGYGNCAKDTQIYALRSYTRALTDLEKAQNHFADLAKWFRLDVADFAAIRMTHVRRTFCATGSAAISARSFCVTRRSMPRAAVRRAIRGRSLPKRGSFRTTLCSVPPSPPGSPALPLPAKKSL